MKILFTQDTLVNGGTERSHLEILSRFSDKVDVGLVYFYPKHHLKDEYDKAGIRLFFLDIPESYHFVQATIRLFKLVKKEKPDLLVSSLWRSDIVTRIVSLTTGVPLIGTLVNDSYCPIAWTDKKDLKYKLVYWIDRLTSGIPVHWIANAQVLADSHTMTLGLDRDNISVVYRGREIPKQTWVSRGKIEKFVSYGRLLERKGFQDLVSALASMEEELPENWSLQIFGEGPYRSELESQVHSLGLEKRVFYPGNISLPANFLVNFDCFIFPSWYEGFSGALVEAMQSGIPIIASDIQMNLEAVSPNETALVFHTKNPLKLADKLKYAIANPAIMNVIGAAARRVAENKFEIEKIAKEYEKKLFEVYREKIQRN